MIGTLFTGSSAMKAFSKGLQVVSDNIANSNTTGYKKERAEYGDTFYNLLKQPSDTDTGLQLGTGVQVSHVSTDFSDAQAEFTGIESDLSISGSGFFEVADSSGELFYTRAGNFQVDEEGYFKTTTGEFLQGTNGNLQLSSPTNGTIASYSFAASTGVLSVTLTNNTIQEIGQVKLQNFTNPSGLVRKGSNLFQTTTASGAGTSVTPSATAIASVHSGYLEGSNVDLTDEFTQMIVAQRSFQASSRIITTADQILQEIVQLKR
jgi:flagellar hook protein FlgE